MVRRLRQKCNKALNETLDFEREFPWQLHSASFHSSVELSKFVLYHWSLFCDTLFNQSSSMNINYQLSTLNSSMNWTLVCSSGYRLSVVGC